MGPLPPLTTNIPNAEQFIRDQECPIGMDVMTEAVTLMPCAHTYNEQSVWMIPGFTGQDNPHPCEAGGARITKVRVVGHINCPLCQHPVAEYLRNWALRSACLSLPGVFNNHHSINVPAPAVGPMPAPIPVAPVPAPVAPGPIPAAARTLKERFAMAVTAAFGILSPMFGAIAISKVDAIKTWGGFGATKYDTTNRDNNAMIALVSSIIASAFIASATYAWMRRE